MNYNDHIGNNEEYSRLFLIVTALNSISGVVHVYGEDGLRAHWQMSYNSAR